MPQPPKLVVFDLGRVLVRICDDWSHACEVAGLNLPAELSCDALRAIRDLSVEGDRGLPIDAWCTRFAQAVDITPQQARQLHDAFTRGHYDGAEELLLDLQQHGIETACLSNTNDNHWRIMSAEPYFLHHLTHRFASHLLQDRKPNPTIYEHVEKTTGFQGNQILFFDDLPENTAAAHERGWRTHTIPIVDNPIPLLRQHLKAESAL